MINLQILVKYKERLGYKKCAARLFIPKEKEEDGNDRIDKQ